MPNAAAWASWRWRTGALACSDGSCASGRLACSGPRSIEGATGRARVHRLLDRADEVVPSPLAFSAGGGTPRRPPSAGTRTFATVRPRPFGRRPPRRPILGGRGGLARRSVGRPRLPAGACSAPSASAASASARSSSRFRGRRPMGLASTPDRGGGCRPRASAASGCQGIIRDSSLISTVFVSIIMTAGD